MQQPGLYEEALQEARQAERRDVKKFYSFRSRLVGPGGTAVLRPTLAMEPDQRIQAIWAPRRALPGSVVSDDDLPTDAADNPAPPASPPPPAPGEGGQYGPAGGQAREQRWYGANRWRNHWQDQPFDDGEPPAAPPADDAWPDDGLVQDESFGDRAYQAQTREEAWPGDRPGREAGRETGRETGAQTRAPVVAPGSGGTPLSWDEDE
jgi:hypothetical protein